MTKSIPRDKTAIVRVQNHRLDILGMTIKGSRPQAIPIPRFIKLKQTGVILRLRAGDMDLANDLQFASGCPEYHFCHVFFSLYQCDHGAQLLHDIRARPGAGDGDP